MPGWSSSIRAWAGRAWAGHWWLWRWRRRCVGAAAAALREQGEARSQRAGTHAAGAVAALALGCAHAALTDHWLSVAVALFLPALAWVEVKADVPALRRVALAVAALRAGAAAAEPLRAGLHVRRNAGAQWAAGSLWRSGRLVRAGRAGCSASAGTTLRWRCWRRAASPSRRSSLRWRSGISQRSGQPFAPETSFLEAALEVASLAVLASVTTRIATRLQRPVLQWGWRVQGTLALAGGTVLLLANPAVTGAPVGHRPLLDWLLPAYVVPGALALVAMRHRATATPLRLRLVLAGYTLLAGFAWITLEIRYLFHPDGMGFDIASGDGRRTVVVVGGMAGLWRSADGRGDWLGERRLRLDGAGVSLGWWRPRSSWWTWAAWSGCGGCCHSLVWDLR